jgi:hypothetical protein
VLVIILVSYLMIAPPCWQAPAFDQGRTKVTDAQEQTPAQKLIGDFAPKLVSLTDGVLFGDIWARPELSPRDRSLITVASLITGGNTEQLRGHLESSSTWRSTPDGPRRCRPSPWPSRSSAADGTCATLR